MSSLLEASVTLANEKIQFKGKSRSNAEVTMDYFPPYGDGEGYTGLELLLVSLAGCSATSIVGILRKMQKNIKGFTVNAGGVRREEHPTSFRTISLEFVLHSPNTSDAEIEKAIKISEDSLCPVWAMIKGNVDIAVSHKIIKE